MARKADGMYKTMPKLNLYSATVGALFCELQFEKLNRHYNFYHESIIIID